MGRKEESNGRRPGRSVTMFLGSMYMADPFVMMPEVSRMSRMEGAVVKTMRSWVTFLETLTQQKSVHSKDIDCLATETLGA